MFVLFALSIFPLSMGTSYSADIEEINAAIQARGGRWVAGETSVSGLPKELKQRLCGLKYDTPENLTGHVVSGRPNLATSSSSLSTVSSPSCSPADIVCDWTNRGGQSYVTSVKDQGQCGSCWAFASTAVLESESLISFKNPGLSLDLSEQIVLSCTSPNDNCENGGSLSDAGNFLMSFGTNLESCYPYTATDGSCSNACSNYFTNPSSNYYINNWSVNYPTYNVWGDYAAAIKNMKNLLDKGPIVGTMDVYDDFYYYTGGVYSCDPNWGSGYQGSHAIEIVGWDSNQQAFHVKNSWGTGWGEQGYFWISYTELFGYTYFAYYSYFFNGAPIINLSSVPSGLQISYNGGSSYTPAQLEWETGSLFSVQAVSPQSGSSGCQFIFAHWSNGAKTPTLTFTEPLVGGVSYTAYFTAQYQLTTTPSGAGTVSPSGSTWHNANTSVSMSAKPSSGYTFYGWSGDVTGAKTPVSILMSAAHNVTANFAQFSLVEPIAGTQISSSSQSPYTIQWNGPSNLVTYTVSYSLNGGAWKIMAGASGLTSPNYSWTIPVVTKATKCLIKVVAYNGNTIIKQLSSGAFTITP